MACGDISYFFEIGQNLEIGKTERIQYNPQIIVN